MRTIIVDDNDLWRTSLNEALKSRGFEILISAADELELARGLELLDQDSVDLAILDLRLPPTWSDEGISLARRLRRRYESIGVILLSGYEQDVQMHYVSDALNHLEAGGGVGYLFKDRTTRESLVNAAQRVAAGGLTVDPMLAQEAVDRYREQAAAMQEFTPRDIEILNLLTQGFTNREIAEAMHVSVVVVERHLTKIFGIMVPETSQPSFNDQGSGVRGENRRVLTVLEWLRRTGRLDQ